MSLALLDTNVLVTTLLSRYHGRSKRVSRCIGYVMGATLITLGDLSPTLTPHRHCVVR